MKNELRKYTTFSAMLPILSRRALFLLSPDRWEDRNDRRFMQRYKELKQIQTLLATCFAAGEGFNHWKTFASTPEGTAITFDKDILTQCINEKHDPHIRHQAVTYMQVNRLRDSAHTIDDIPFLKRFPYKSEQEYRIIYESKDDRDKRTFEISFELNAVKSIILSPWLNEALVPSMQSIIRSIEGCRDLNVYQSTLLENRAWLDGLNTKWPLPDTEYAEARPVDTSATATFYP